MTFAGWSDAAFGYQSAEDKCRLDYVIGLMSSTFGGSRHMRRRAPKSTRKLVESSLGGEVYALSEMADHMLLLEDFRGPFGRVNPGEVGLGNCESLFTHLKTKKMIAEKYLVRHFSRIQQASEGGGVANPYWPQGTENPADGLTKVRIDTAPPCDPSNLVDCIQDGYAPSKVRHGRSSRACAMGPT